MKSIYKTYKQKKNFLDPIHGPISFDLNDEVDFLLIKIIDSKEFQRLKRIHQMGLGWLTFHGAEHSRFGHSLGALFLAKKIVDHLSKDYKQVLNFRAEILVSALIHDVGHGPFSHSSESATGFNHEEWTKKIITDSSEINSILNKSDKSLVKKIVNIFKYSPYPYLGQIISSYVDCDRLDYLHRDSYYVGVPYGLTGSERIINSLEVDSGSKRLIIRESIGLDTVVHYLHARKSMYQQIYQHKKNLANDFLLRKIVERVKEVKPNNLSSHIREWLNFENKSISKIKTSSFIRVDDFLILSQIQNWADDSPDPILKDLSYKFSYRKLFKALEFRSEVEKNEINQVFSSLKALCKSKDLNSKYYFGIEESHSKPYEASVQKTGKAIFIKQNNGIIKELSKVSNLVHAMEKKIVKTCLVFSPELEKEIHKIKNFNKIFK